MEVPTCIDDFDSFFLGLCHWAEQANPRFDIATIKNNFGKYTELHRDTLETFLVLSCIKVFEVVSGRYDADTEELKENFPYVSDWQMLGDLYLDEKKPINKWSNKDWEAVCVLLASDLVKP